MEIRFENKVAFITGAAGGIGYAAARMFAEAGASVVMADLDSRVTDRAKELEAEKGIRARGIRLDSGDLAYLTKKARKMLDDAGFEDAIISASSDLDEYLIDSLKTQGAAITSWGVGTNLITSKDNPAFGGVYKLAAVMGDDGTFIPKIK